MSQFTRDVVDKSLAVFSTKYLQSNVTSSSHFLFQNFFYSRKNFMKPTHQEFPHRNFQEEVEFLSQIFPSTVSHPENYENVVVV